MHALVIVAFVVVVDVGSAGGVMVLSVKSMGG